MTRSGAPAQTLPTCKLFDQLLFIKDTVINRPSVSNLPMHNEDSESLLFTPPESPLQTYPCEDPKVSSPCSSKRKIKGNSFEEIRKKEKLKIVQLIRHY